MKRSLLLFGVAVMGIVAGFILGVARSSTTDHSIPAVRTSFAFGDDMTTKFVQSHVKSIEWPDGNGVVARYRVGGATTPNQYVSLIGRTPRSIPDDHGSTTLAVIGVQDGKATISALSEFDHGAFGKNLVTVDSRIVEVDVTPSAP